MMGIIHLLIRLNQHPAIRYRGAHEVVTYVNRDHVRTDSVLPDELSHRLAPKASAELISYESSTKTLVAESELINQQLLDDEIKWSSHKISNWDFNQDLITWYLRLGNTINSTESLQVPPIFDQFNQLLVDAQTSQLNAITEIQTMLEQSGDLGNTAAAYDDLKSWSNKLLVFGNTIGLPVHPTGIQMVQMV